MISMWLSYLFIVFAQAEKPKVAISKDGYITVVLSSPVAEPQLRRFLADPYAYEKIDDKVSVSVLSQTPPCTNIEYTAQGNRYQVKMCESKQGFELNLLESPTLKTYHAVWILQPQSTGTIIDYKIKIEPKIYIPQFLLNQKMKGDVYEFFEALQQHLAGKK